MMSGINTVIGMAGGTSSGKTTFARKVAGEFDGSSVVLMHQDSYYKDMGRLTDEDRARVNFDHPDSLDNGMLIEHVRALKEGRAVEIPVYDFSTHSRRPEKVRVEPVDVIIVEGILVLHDPGLRELMDIKIFIDTDADIRFIRRLERDMCERERTFESVVEQYITTVRPMHEVFVESTKRFADVIVPEGGDNRIALDMVVARVKTILSGKAKLKS